MGLTRFGGLWIDDGFTAISVDDTSAIFTSWEHGAAGPGTTVDADAGTLRVDIAGFYIGYCNISALVAAADTVFFEFRVNDVAWGAFKGSAEGIASGGVVNIAFMGGARLNEGDVVSVYVYSNNAGGTAVTPVDAQFGLIGV